MRSRLLLLVIVVRLYLLKLVLLNLNSLSGGQLQGSHCIVKEAFLVLSDYDLVIST